MERRIAPRHHVVRRAQIGSGSMSISCATFDLSVTGARLCLLEAGDFPPRVFLRLQDGAVRVARRRWQRDMQVGVEFESQSEE